MPKRNKVLLFLVEGQSDRTALGILFDRYFSENQVSFHVLYGDITSSRDTTTQNVKSRVGEIVKKFADENGHLRQSDFLGVIHIMDTDGTYIPDSHVIMDTQADSGPVYSPTEIRSSNPENIQNRNQRKKQNMNVLQSMKRTWKSVPYRAYYMSSNLDHALYNQQNLTDEEKEDLAYKFVRQYRENIPGLIEFFTHSSFSVCTDYDSSWKFIQQNLHSLQRYTNLGLCFGAQFDS